MLNIVYTTTAVLLLFFSSFSFAEQKDLLITGLSDWQPFSFINEEGKADGIMVDFWRLYGKKNNVSIQFHLLPWHESLDYARNNSNVVHASVGAVIYNNSTAFPLWLDLGFNNLSTKEIDNIYQKWLPENQNLGLFTLNNVSFFCAVLSCFGLIFYHYQLRLKNKKLKLALSELAASTTKLKNFAEKDSLTGAKTRHQFFNELSNKRFSIMPYVVVVLGIDKLKLINERHGQDIGDMVLKHLTAQLKWQLSSNNLYARLCGGEFAILFYGMDKKEAEIKLNQLQRNLKENPLYVDQQIIPVEVSVGIACYPSDEKQGEALVRIAASRMRSGRSFIENERDITEVSPSLFGSFTR